MCSSDLAWTSDVGSRWTANWPSWDQNTRFWEQLARWAMGPPINRDFKVDVVQNGSDAQVTVEDIQDGKFGDLQQLTLTVSSPGGSSSQVPLRQVAAGEYVATVVADTPGVYELDVAESADPRRGGRTESNGFVVPAVVETTSFVANEQVLRRIASESGGLLRDPSGGELFEAARTADASRWDPIWAVFAILALVCFVFDVAVRRLRPATLRALFGRSVVFKGPR